MYQTKYDKFLNAIPMDSEIDSFLFMGHKLTSLSTTKPEILAGVNKLSLITAKIFKEDK